MARFRVTAGGRAQNTISCLGTSQSGAWAQVNGWDAGVKVVASVEAGRDVFQVFRTEVSDGDPRWAYVCTIS